MAARVAALTGKTELPQIGSVIYARKPGDGSAREQAASCQRVLGGSANIALEYATKRYRSNLINWGMIPFVSAEEPSFEVGDYLLIPGIRQAILDKAETVSGYVIRPDGSETGITLQIPPMTDDERRIILDGCLINYYRAENSGR